MRNDTTHDARAQEESLLLPDDAASESTTDADEAAVETAAVKGQLRLAIESRDMHDLEAAISRAENHGIH